MAQFFTSQSKKNRTLCTRYAGQNTLSARLTSPPASRWSYYVVAAQRLFARYRWSSPFPDKLKITNIETIDNTTV
ncbi:MAG: hypothetical protein V2A54_07795 [Bacteroidota bacterium]